MKVYFWINILYTSINGNVNICSSVTSGQTPYVDTQEQPLIVFVQNTPVNDFVMIRFSVCSDFITKLSISVFIFCSVKICAFKTIKKKMLDVLKLSLRVTYATFQRCQKFSSFVNIYKILERRFFVSTTLNASFYRS